MITEFLDMGARSTPNLVGEYWVRRKRVLDLNRIRCRARSSNSTVLVSYQRARTALQAVETELIKRGVYQQGRIVRPCS